MLVAHGLVVLLLVGRSLANPSVLAEKIKAMNCSSLCGLPFKASARYTGTTLSVPMSSSTNVNFSGQCAHESDLPIVNWKKSAWSFLSRLYMDEPLFDCPKWNMVYRSPKEAERPKYAAAHDFQVSHSNKKFPYRPYFETFVEDPEGHCRVTVDRGVMKPNVWVRMITADLQYAGNPLTTTGSIISLWRPGLWGYTLQHPIPMQVKHGQSSVCRGTNCAKYDTMWLPASMFDTSVFYKKGSTQHYSIFAKFSFRQLPGVEKLMLKLRDSTSHLEEVANDLSPSNVAILSLPLLMAIPPISLLEHVSGMATAWYVFATDILAALPLLIKGTELVIEYSKSRERMYSTLSMTGKKYSIYERWYLECNPPVVITQTAGTILISVAIWFMLASSYSEFAFWRARQYRHGRLNKIPEIIMDKFDEECEQVKQSNSSDSKKRSSSWYARHRFHLAAGAFLCVIALFITSMATRSPVVCVMTSTALVVFRLIQTNSLSHLLQRDFVFGFVFGTLLGPLCFPLQLKKSVRDSTIWSPGSGGPSIGMAVFGTLLSVFIGRSDQIHVFFAWFYGGATIALHAIRCVPAERVWWQYGLNGFATGILFGPFGILFKRCFPETDEDGLARENFHGGFAFGLIVLLTVVNWIVRFWKSIRYSPY